MTKRDIVSLHRDRGRSPGDTASYPRVDPTEDAPQARPEELSGEVLVEALRSVEPGSDAERALILAINAMAAHSSGGGNGITRVFFRRLVLLGLAVLALVQPTVSQVAERIISPSSALERKLDESLMSQARLQEQQQEIQATFIALSKWVVEVELARAQGRPMPEPPAPVRLILIQDELTRGTGR